MENEICCAEFDLLLSARDIGRAEFRWWWCRRTGERNVLHAQVRQQPFDHLRLLGIEVAARFLFQHAEHINPVLRGLQVDTGLACNWMGHHAERGCRIRCQRHDQADETRRVIQGIATRTRRFGGVCRGSSRTRLLRSRRWLRLWTRLRSRWLWHTFIACCRLGFFRLRFFRRKLARRSIRVERSPVNYFECWLLFTHFLRVIAEH